MTGTVTKGLIQRQDLDNFDGTLATERADSTGGILSGLKVGDVVDILSVYGGGDPDAKTVATINKAFGALGSNNLSLAFAPGTWTIDDNVTIAANFTSVVPGGAIFAVSAGKTLTFDGVLFRQHTTYTSGAGTVVVNGIDVLANASYSFGYAADTGAADAYVMAPAQAATAYTAGQVFRFKAANANTGASTINVSGLGTKDIRKDVSSVLEAGDIAVGEIVTVVYDGTNFQVLTTISMVEAAASSTIPSGTVMLFVQTAAPTGWTKQSTHNDKLLRLVTGTASTGGTGAFSTVFAAGTTGSTTLTVAQIPAHTHDYLGVTSGPLAGGGGFAGSTEQTGSIGGGTGHTHAQTAYDPSYVDCIIATMD